MNAECRTIAPSDFARSGDHALNPPLYSKVLSGPCRQEGSGVRYYKSAIRICRVLLRRRGGPDAGTGTERKGSAPVTMGSARVACRALAGAGMVLLPVAVALGGECPPEGGGELWWRSAGAEAVAACFPDEAAVNPPPAESGDAPAAPLFQAARFSRDPAVVAALLAAGAKIEPPGSDWWEGADTALHVAARYNENPAVVAELARAGAGFLDQRDEEGNHPLHVAAAFNPNPAVVGVLLEAGASVDAEDSPDRNTPLHHALRSNRSPAVALRLIEAGADVNAGNIDGHGGDTPMHYAARYSVFPAIVAALVGAGADVNTRNRRGSQPTDWYRYSDDDARLAATGETPLHHAAQYNANPALVDALVAVGADVGATGGDLLDTPLHYAAQHNPNPAVVEALVEAGADVNARNRAVNPTWIIQDHLNGVTPLHRAAAANPNPAVVEALLRAGAEVDARDAEGATPLHFAAGRNANPDVVRVLVAAGAAVDAEVVVPGEVLNDLPLDYGSTPLEIAIGINRNPAVAEALVDGGAALDAEAVRLAEQEGRAAVAAWLRAAGAERRLGLDRDARRLVRSGLVAAGYAPGPAHGRTGKRPRDAIQRWQAVRGAPVTGYLDAAEAAELQGLGREREEKRRAAVEASKFRDCEGCPEMVVVPEGSFRMGSPESEELRDVDEGPMHRVTFAHPFAVGVHEVTRGEFARFVEATGRSMGDACWTAEGGKHEERPGRHWKSPGYSQTDAHPVVCVSWEDAQAYVAWLSEETGAAYRLLSESEWEYVARAGTGTGYWWGDERGWNRANCDGCGSRWDGEGTAPVGSFPANAFGLHDVLGNVWEWVEDCWNGSYRGAPSDGSAWESGECSQRVLRGSSWINWFPRSATRALSPAVNRDGLIGFRVARTLTRTGHTTVGPWGDGREPSREVVRDEEDAPGEGDSGGARADQGPTPPMQMVLPDEWEEARIVEMSMSCRMHGYARPRPGTTFRDCSESPEMVVVPAGSFMMGSPESEEGRQESEGPVHQVTFARPFAVGVYEVTFEEWDACVAWGGCGGYRPDDEGEGRGRRPVVNVSWQDAQAYVAWLSQETGAEYRLLSEAEWEYVARAGTTGPYHFGSSPSPSQANYGQSPGGTVPVGSYPANAFGLHDVHGNVTEWVEDCWIDGYRGAPSDGGARRYGDFFLRVLRGGAWSFHPHSIRSAGRFLGFYGNRYDHYGFRVARTLTP